MPSVRQRRPGRGQQAAPGPAEGEAGVLEVEHVVGGGEAKGREPGAARRQDLPARVRRAALAPGSSPALSTSPRPRERIIGSGVASSAADGRRHDIQRSRRAPARRREARARPGDLPRRERGPRRSRARRRALPAHRGGPDRRLHRPARRRQEHDDRLARQGAPSSREARCGPLDRPLQPVHPRRPARRPDQALGALPRRGRLHPLDGQPRRARRPRRGDAAVGARDGRRRLRRRPARDGRRRPGGDRRRRSRRHGRPRPHARARATRSRRSRPGSWRFPT